MALEQSYTTTASGGAVGSGSVSTEQTSNKYWPLTKCRRAYADYLWMKRQEMNEQREARHYYHGSQFTAEQIRILRDRRQPIMTYNRFARKIDAAIGTAERLKQDPKAYARTPMHEEGADLATAVLRYVTETAKWDALAPRCAREAAIDGMAGVEMVIEQGDQGDPDVGFVDVDLTAFFYDPMSKEEDFSDAGYMGVGRWFSVEKAKEQYPDAPDGAFSDDLELVSESEMEARWFKLEGVRKQVRIVEIWYEHKGGWCWTVFSGNAILEEGASPFKDEKGKSTCKFIMFSAYVDQDGDRYGFHRNLKSPQDGLNQAHSKIQHMLGSNRLLVGAGGAGIDIEKVRAEWARPDGVVVIPAGKVGEDIVADDKSVDLAGWTKLLELRTAELENFGPNQALVGEGGVETNSGRAIAMLQQAGLAELGPFLLAYKGWKLRVYRACWNAVQRFWQSERWIRVTDNMQLAQYVQINQVGIDPQTGMPTIINPIGSLDVDIIIDEGPDSITTQQNDYETMQALASNGAIPPQLLIDLSPLTGKQKQQAKQTLEQMQAQMPQPVDPSVAKLEQAKMDGQIKLVQLEQDSAFKQKELEQNAFFEQQRIDQEQKFTAQKQANEFANTKAKRDNDMQASREKNAFDMQAAREKNDNDTAIAVHKIKSESDAKAAGAETQAAPFAKLADKLVKSIDGLASKVDESAEEIKAALAAPRKIDLQRDAKGNVTGGKSVVAA